MSDATQAKRAVDTREDQALERPETSIMSLVKMKVKVKVEAKVKVKMKMKVEGEGEGGR